MATFRIDIVVNPGNAENVVRRVGKGLEDTEKKAQRATSTLRNLFILREAAQYGAAVVKIADAYTTIENKLRIASRTTDEFNSSMKRVFDVARRSRSNVEDIASGYQRISESTRDMGLSQDQVWKVTETLSKSLRVSGATAQEAASTMTQFTQALTKGKLNGDEMRSIMENNIVVQRALAKQLGTSRDALLDLSKAGEITAEVMIGALLAAAEDVDAEFAKTGRTIGDAFTQARNDLIELAGEFNKSAHLGDAFTAFLGYVIEQARLTAEGIGAIIGAVKELDDLTGNLASGALGDSSATGVAKRGVRLITPGLAQLGAFKEIYDEGLGNYFAGQKKGDREDLSHQLMVAMTGKRPDEIGKEFLDGIQKSMGGKEFNGLDVAAFFDEIGYQVSEFSVDFKENLDKQAKAAKTGGDAFKKLRKDYRDLVDGLYPVIKAQHDMRDTEVLLQRAQQAGLVTKARAAEILARQRDALKDALDPLQAYLDEVQREIDLNELRTRTVDLGQFEAERATREKILEMQKAGNITTKAELDLATFLIGKKMTLLELSKRTAEASDRDRQERSSLLSSLGIASAEDQLFDQLALVERSYQQAVDRANTTFAQATAANVDGRPVDEMADIRKRLFAEKALHDSLAAAESARTSGTVAAANDNYIPKATTDSERYARALTILQDTYRGTADSQDAMTEAMRRLDEQFGLSTERTEKLQSANEKLQSGWSQGWRNILATTGDTATMLATTMTNAFSSIENAVVSLVTTGKASFEELTNAILGDLTRLIIRMITFKLITEAISFFGGGGGGNWGSMESNGLMRPNFEAANGTSFRVPGAGGTDTQRIVGAVSPGETVEVRTPAQQAEYERRMAGGGGGGVHVTAVIVDDRRQAMAVWGNSPAGQRAQAETLRKNPALLRAAR